MRQERIIQASIFDVFAGHEIGTAGRQTTLVPALEQFLQYAKDPANGVWLDTVENVAKYIRAKQARVRE